MNLIASFNKPEYVYRPSQIIRRILREFQRKDLATVQLPWGLPIGVNTTETIGSCIWRVGLYDLIASETLWRMAEPGEQAVDVGANIGHMTSLLAARIGGGGRVTAFEPHPIVFERLWENAAKWIKPEIAEIESVRLALSEKRGAAYLSVPENFSSNNGLASLSTQEKSKAKHQVETSTLDDIYSDRVEIGVMKIDVEGHELAVLKGGKSMIESQLIRDIVFEENGILPSPTTQWLETHGYTLFNLNSTLFGPEISPLNAGKKAGRRDAPNFLATLAPERAKRIFKERGWKALGKTK